MLWPILTFILICLLIALHLRWKRRFDSMSSHCRSEIMDLKDELRQRAAQSESQQHALFNSMAEGLILLDRDGRIHWANRAVGELFQISSDIRNQTLMEAFRSHELADLVSRVAADKQVLGHELSTGGLTPLFLEVNATAVLSSDGEQTGTVLVFHDLTRLKQLENTRQEFVANVSHELRTPLSLIKGYAETLLEGARNDPEVATRFLQKIEKNTARLTFLIEDLLTISRLESGQVSLAFEPVEARTVAERVVEDLRARAAEKGITFSNEISDALVVQADVQRLQQVFVNLADNAIKYGRTNGVVTLGGRPMNSHQVELWVRDDGPGIPPESTERIFERFYRLDKARSREQGGTGLGLSIVKHIVQRHGGEVGVRSEPDKGSTFYFTLPKG